MQSAEKRAEVTTKKMHPPMLSASRNRCLLPQTPGSSKLARRDGNQAFPQPGTTPWAATWVTPPPVAESIQVAVPRVGLL
jgi:hypothetical protein